MWVDKKIESKEKLTVAGEVLMSISKDEREKAIFRNRKIVLADYESNMLTAEYRGKMIGKAEGKTEGREEGIAEGKEVGIAIGREEGRAEGIINIVRNAIKMKMPMDDILALTGLTRDDLDKLREFDKINDNELI